MMFRLCALTLPVLLCFVALTSADEPATTSRPATTRPRFTTGIPRSTATRPATRPTTSLRPPPTTYPAASRPAATVELLAVCIGEDPEKKFAAGGYEVTVDLHLKNLGGKILGPRTALTLKDFSDDKGTALVRRSDFVGSKPSSNARLFVSPDMDAAVISVYGNIKPSPGATKFVIEGTVRVLVGSNLMTTKIDNLRLHLGEKFSASETQLMIASLHENVRLPKDLPSTEARIGFSALPRDGLVAIHVFDKSGVSIGQGVAPMIDSIDRAPLRTNAIDCTVNDPPRDVALEVDFLKTIETVEIPIKIEVPIKGAFYIGDVPNTYQRIIEAAKPEKKDPAP